VQHFEEAIALRQLFQAAPVLRPALGARKLFLHHSEFHLAGTDCLDFYQALFFHSS